MENTAPMLRPFCRCKIHHAIVTAASLDYIGSMTIPEDIMQKLGICEGEQVECANVTSGERWTTYAITGKTGEYSLNGAAAHMGKIGDKLIIMIFCLLDEKEIASHRMKIAFLGEGNTVVRMQD
jgi:aspartate 1-decarboxylase